jgi:hypothetical protein
LRLTDDIAEAIRTRLERAKSGNPGIVSKDGKAVILYATIGYNCYFSPDGDIYTEDYDLASNAPSTFYRDQRAQTQALVLASQIMPELARLLPKRPLNALTCGTCEGDGRIHRAIFPRGILCDECLGLGWIENEGPQPTSA